MTRFEGIFPIVNTPFCEDGTIDIDSQLRLVRFLLDAGVHGLALFGNASEGYALSGAEREQLMRVILDEVQGRIPVFVSTGHTGTDVAVDLSREAERAGADGVMVLPPYYLRPDANGVFEYFRAISDSISIPIMVQDAPLMTQVTMSAPLLARMGQDLEHVRYVKIEAPPTAVKVGEVRSLAGDALTIFGGLNGNFLIEELERGARGTMPGCDMVDQFVSIWNARGRGDGTQAWEGFARLLPLIRYELQPGMGVAVMKHNLKAAGVIASDRVRHPTRALDPIGVCEVERTR
ncbi:MAG: dihydrodipicolinate synthase family protein, partial [Acidobacteria bacterium]|nr:dihydrodipicolinate synthase family protein [Acidobacteriota bacterium]